MARTLDRIGRCPTDVDHGRLLDIGPDRWTCPHAEHLSRANDDEPERRRNVWGRDELVAAGALP